MKKKKNIWLIILSLLFLGVTLYSLVGGWGVEEAAQAPTTETFLERSIGMIQSSSPKTILP